MANVVQLNNLKNYIPYQSDGMRQWLDGLTRFMPPSLVNSDGLAFYVSSALTTTAVAVNASGGYLHGIFIQSNGALGYLSLWNVAQGSVTVGTTSQTLALPFTATSGHSTAISFFGTGNGTSPIFNTALTAAVATTVTGNSAVATLPLVIIAYS